MLSLREYNHPMPASHNSTFDLAIDPRTGHGYPVRAESERGQVREWCMLVLDAPEFVQALNAIANEKADRAALMAFGRILAESVLVGKVRDLFRETLGAADEVRLRLRIAPPELATLPWELLWPDDEPLSISARCVITRFIEAQTPVRALTAPRPLRMLVIIPQGSGLNTEREKSALIDALAGMSESLQVEWLEGVVTPDRLRAALDRAETHLVHFIGHGAIRNGKFALRLNDEFGDDYHFSAESFAGFFRERESLRLIVLNACKGADALMGVAPLLARQGIPAVVAMQWDINDRVAREFAGAFYHSLCAGSEAGDVDVAMGRARAALHDDYRDSRAFATPALFLRTDERRLWADRIPFMAEPPPPDFVPRPHEFNSLISNLLSQHDSPVAITTALRGAGGYGKTTLAKAVCADARVREAFPDGVLWVTLGERPGELIGKVMDWIEALTGERPGFTGIDAAKAALAGALGERKCLLVIDDAWNESHLRPFLHGGQYCARLITTRDSATLPLGAIEVNVNAMRPTEAVALLSVGLPANQASGLSSNLAALAKRLGEWPILLKLVNRALLKQIEQKAALPEALASVNRRLDKYGMTAFDSRNAVEREQAVAKTLNISFELLSVDEYARYTELAVFPEDAYIPLSTVARLWSVTGRLDEEDAKALCGDLYQLSLLLDFDRSQNRIRLHDVFRKYLSDTLSERLRELHGKLLNTYSLKHWADLPADEPYLWDWLAYHLIEARRDEELRTTVMDLRYLAVKTLARDSHATEADLAKAEVFAPDDVPLRLLKRNFGNMTHLLNGCETLNDVGGVMHSRLQHLPELASACREFERDLPRPCFALRHPLPDLPHPTLIRTLVGHTDRVTGCAVSPDGAWIVSASSDNTLKVWDARTGAERLTLRGHTRDVWGCAVGPDGTWVVSASWDKTLKVWEARTGAERLTLRGHTNFVNACAVSPDGAWIISASDDGMLKMWEARTGAERLTLRGQFDGVWGCAVSPDGAWMVSASSDHTLKVWDARTGAERLTLRGHTYWVWGCAVSPDGAWIVSGSLDKTLKVWDARTGVERLTLQGHTDSVYGCAVSPDGAWIVSASDDKTLKVWDARTGAERLTLQGHTDSVYGCAVSPDGAWMVSASDDKTLKVWDVSVDSTRTGAERILQGHTNRVWGCAVSPDGAWVVSASDDKTLKVWDARTRAQRLTLRGHRDRVSACAVSPDGAWIVSASVDKTLKVWDARTGAERLTLQGHANGVRGCAVSPDGAWIVSASSDDTLKVWDARTGAERLTLRGHTYWVQGCAVSPDGAWIVSGSLDKTLKVWDARTGVERLTLQGHTWAVNGCAISPDGTWIVSVSEDKTLKVWDARTGAERLTLRGHTLSVSACAVSPDGMWIASASEDKTLKVWDARTGACLLTFPVEGALDACAVFPDGEHVVAVGRAGVYWLRVVR